MFLPLILNLAGILLLLATLPLATELLVLTAAALLGPRRPSKSAIAGSNLRLAVIVPAHNEELLIGRCVQSILSARNTNCEVLVVAHNCTDQTAANAQAAGADVLVLDDASQTGKGKALSYGMTAALARGADAVLIIDADSVVSPNLIPAARRSLSTGCSALQCRYEVYNATATQRTRLMALAFQAMNIVRPRGRNRLGLSSGIFGNGFALRREVLDRVPYNAHSVVEDLEYHLNLVRAGIKVEFVEEAAVQGEMPVTTRGNSTQRARWEGGRLRMMRQWAPRLFGEVLRGRLRLSEPLLDLLSIPMAIQVSLLMLALLLPIGWLRIYSLTAMAIIVGHLLVAATAGPSFWNTLKALVTAPAFIVWKLRMIPTIWRTSRAGAAWVRTQRNSAQ